MGRQVGFYMAQTDEVGFITFLRSSLGPVIMRDESASPDPVVLDVLPQPDVPGWFMLWLWNREISPKPCFEFLPKRNLYSIRRFESEIIEFSRSIHRSGGLAPGRLWAEMVYWDLSRDPPCLVCKGAAFQKWYDGLTTWIKRQGKRTPAGQYVLPGAAEFVSQGGHLCGL